MNKSSGASISDRHWERGLGIIFSLRDGFVWASWPDSDASVRLGSHDLVAAMMRGFLGQDAIGLRLSQHRADGDRYHRSIDFCGFWPGGLGARAGLMLKKTPADIESLKLLDGRLRWLSTWTIHHANHIRESADGLKVGGHQASCASMTAIMAALYFHALGPNDRVAVKPHAGPVLHATHYLPRRPPPGSSTRFITCSARSHARRSKISVASAERNPIRAGRRTRFPSTFRPAPSAWACRSRSPPAWSRIT